MNLNKNNKFQGSDKHNTKYRLYAKKIQKHYLFELKKSPFVIAILVICVVIFSMPESFAQGEESSESWKNLSEMPTARNGITASELNGVIFVFGEEDTVKTFDENEAYISQDARYTLQSLPVPRQGLFSSVVDDTIYVMGGGFVPGASYSNLNHAYQNNAIPEFGIIVVLVFILSLLVVISTSRYFGKNQTILYKNN